jgi:hypothetical protein
VIGTHIFDREKMSILSFYANYKHNTNRVIAAHVVVDGISFPLTLESGTMFVGTWRSEEFTLNSM